MKLSVGDLVYFGRRNGEKTLGEVIKVNRTKAKVRQLESRGRSRIRAEGAVWGVPFSLLTPADRAKPAPAVPKAKRPDAIIIQELLNVDCALSPENLHCDGEISRTAAHRKARILNAQRRKLITELGREPSAREILDSYDVHVQSRLG